MTTDNKSLDALLQEGPKAAEYAADEYGHPADEMLEGRLCDAIEQLRADLREWPKHYALAIAERDNARAERDEWRALAEFNGGTAELAEMTRRLAKKYGVSDA